MFLNKILLCAHRKLLHNIRALPSNYLIRKISCSFTDHCSFTDQIQLISIVLSNSIVWKCFPWYGNILEMLWKKTSILWKRSSFSSVVSYRNYWGRGGGGRMGDENPVVKETQKCPLNSSCSFTYSTFYL